MLALAVQGLEHQPRQYGGMTSDIVAPCVRRNRQSYLEQECWIAVVTIEAFKLDDFCFQEDLIVTSTSIPLDGATMRRGG